MQSVFSLAKSLQLILEISATNSFVSYLLADSCLIYLLHAQCMIFMNNVKLCSVQWCVTCHFFPSNQCYLYIKQFSFYYTKTLESAFCTLLLATQTRDIQCYSMIHLQIVPESNAKLE